MLEPLFHVLERDGFFTLPFGDNGQVMEVFQQLLVILDRQHDLSLPTFVVNDKLLVRYWHSRLPAIACCENRIETANCSGSPPGTAGALGPTIS